MMKVKLLLFLSVFIFLFTCGIEDIIYFREPQDITVDGVNPEKNMVYFYGFNQEETEGNYLFVGYDVYYYFGSSSSAKKAAVKNPYVPTSTNLIDYKSTDDAYRFANFTNTNDLYQQFTIPVTVEMIEDVLKEGNSDNVKFCFHDYGLITDGRDNPYIDSSSSKKKLLVDLVYPQFSEYQNKDWADYDDINGAYDDFKGFYDWDYYEALNIPYSAFGTGYRDYKMYIYIVARGFSSSSMDQDYITSIKSDVKTITLRVLDTTDGND